MRRALPDELSDWIEVVVADNVEDLLRYFGRRVHEPEDAADLLGVALLVLWEKGEKIPVDDEGARMWCFGIARNVARDHYRKSVRRVALVDGLRDQLRSSPLNDNNAADVAAEERMRGREVREAVASLDESSRELVILLHWDGFSIAQAARLLAMNVSTARSRYARALRRLQGHLDSLPAPQRADCDPLDGSGKGSRAARMS